MPKTIKARYSKGKIEPLEKVDIVEGTELLIILLGGPSRSAEDRLERSAGAWKGTIDVEKLVNDIYNSRLVSTRDKVEL
jgi:predicted DNA-binding antitoxin AbrB/MazE fold protein